MMLARDLATVWPALGPDDVHIWHVPLRRAPGELDVLIELLDDDERARAARFRFEVDREEWIAARGLLRRVLGGYLGCEPPGLEFSYGAHGKPSLKDMAGSPSFNVSHTRGLAVFAIAASGPVGIDVERVHHLADRERLQRQFFSEIEHREIEDELDFFRCWTRKEAYLKARGAGLSIPLSSFDVPLGALLEPRPVASREPGPDAHGWYVQDVGLCAPHVAAVARRRPAWQIRVLQA